MRVFLTRWVARFAKGENIDEERLAEAIARAERGLIDADLGGGLIKQRVARKRQGRSGGFRLLIAYESRERAVFLIGFAKSNRDNIRPSELASYKDLARDLLSTSEAALEADVAAGKLLEMEYDEEQEEAESD